jgi:hypothetical protein
MLRRREAPWLTHARRGGNESLLQSARGGSFLGSRNLSGSRFLFGAREIALYDRLMAAGLVNQQGAATTFLVTKRKTT